MSSATHKLTRSAALFLFLLVVMLFLPRVRAAEGEGPQVSDEVVPVVIRTDYIEGGSGTRLLPSSEMVNAFGQGADQTDGGVLPKANFHVTYVNVWPAEAQAALEYALNLWASYLYSPVTIEIQAGWADLKDAAILGSSGPSVVVTEFPNQPVANTRYPVALANKLAGTDLWPKTSTRSGTDINMSFNSAFKDWYFGLDGQIPTDEGTPMWDFVTVALHEIAHGLGFIGSMDYIGGYGYYGDDGQYPFIYDRFARNGAGVPLLSFSSGSTALGAQLVSNNLYFVSPSLTVMTGPQGARLFAPNSWVGGSSYSHLDESAYPGASGNSLMTPYVFNGEVVHVPGPYAQGVLLDLGWTIRSQVPTPTPTLRSTLLPVITPTPRPTLTASKLERFYLPAVFNKRSSPATSVSGIVRLNGSPAVAVPLELCILKRGACQQVSVTTSTPDGSYLFQDVPNAISGQAYYVRYWNTAVTLGRVYYWAEPLLIKAGERNIVRAFEIGDFALGTPAAGDRATLPVTFSWKMRTASGTANEGYTLSFYDGDLTPHWWQDVSHAGAYILDELPTSKVGSEAFTYGSTYHWEVWACDPGAGCGVSLESRELTLTAPAAADPAAGPAASSSAISADQNPIQAIFYADTRGSGPRP